MIEYTTGNLFDADTDALVNTVNCVGVMGKGIALQFKQAYPQNFKEYEQACKLNEVVPGKMLVHDLKSLLRPRFIVNFPTKRHWKEKSRLSDIVSGLHDLINQIRLYDIQSIAVPPLGCGNGGLDWREVKPIIESFANQLPEVKFLVFEPAGSPEPDKIKIQTEKPKLTRARSLFIMLMKNYALPGYKLSLLEIQKLAYFLQEAGEPLKLNFKKYLYGPYAENLNHVLQKMDGHFIKGYGDRSKNAQIYLLPEAEREAQAFLAQEQCKDNRADELLQKVTDMITGFETPYGLELLATVHWVIKHNPEKANDFQFVLNEFMSWNDRKKKVFKPNHIDKAWRHIPHTMNITIA